MEQTKSSRLQYTRVSFSAAMTMRFPGCLYFSQRRNYHHYFLTQRCWKQPASFVQISLTFLYFLLLCNLQGLARVNILPAFLTELFV